MSLDNRLQRVTQHLSPLQRIVLILQAQRAGKEPDSELGRVSDPQQRRAFNRFATLVYVVNQELGNLCYTNAGFSQFIDRSADQVRLLEQAAALLEADLGIEPVKRPRDWRNLKGELTVPEFLRSLAAELRREIVESLAQRWQELGALEEVWAELAAEFGGEDPVYPEHRAMAGETRDRLLALAAEFGARRRLTAPTEAQVAEVRQVVDAAFAQLEPLL